MTDLNMQQKINQQVWKMYPEFKGIIPEERALPSGSNKDTAFILTYKTRVSLPGGRELPLWVKVNVSSSGEILKISSSK